MIHVTQDLTHQTYTKERKKFCHISAVPLASATKFTLQRTKTLSWKALRSLPWLQHFFLYLFWLQGWRSLVSFLSVAMGEWPHAGLLSNTMSFQSPCPEAQRWPRKAWLGPAAPQVSWYCPLGVGLILRLLAAWAALGQRLIPPNIQASKNVFFFLSGFVYL